MPVAKTGTPLIFVSHLSEEREAALELRGLLDRHFGGQAEFFVSSDETSILVGDNWLEKIHTKLRKARAMVILCSPESIHRQWIQFEAGAAWIREIPVMPVCIAHMTPRNLPEPMNRLQAVDARDTENVKKLIHALAEATHATVAAIDVDRFVAYAQELDARQEPGSLFPKLYSVSADIHNDLPQLIRSTRQTLTMSGIHFNISLTNRFADYWQALISGVCLRICAVRPESTAVEYLADFLGEELDVLRSECMLTPAIFEKLKRMHQKEAVSNPKIGRLELRLNERAPMARGYLIDHGLPSGRLLFTPYLHRRESVRTPSLLFHQSQSVYSAFAESMMSSMEAAAVFYDSAST